MAQHEEAGSSRMAEIAHLTLRVLRRLLMLIVNEALLSGTFGCIRPPNRVAVV